MKGKGPASFYRYKGRRKEKKQIPEYLKYCCIKAEEPRRIFSKQAENRI